MGKADYRKQKAGKSFPGDVSRDIKIQMLEKPRGSIRVFAWQSIPEKAARAWAKGVKRRMNKRFRRRSKAELR